MKKTRRRFKQTTTFRHRVTAFANNVRGQAEQTESAESRKQLLRRVRKADTALDIDEWISGHKERPELLEVIFEKLADRGAARTASEAKQRAPWPLGRRNEDAP